MKDQIEIQIDGEVLKANKREFKSGKDGYGWYGKVHMDGDRYQATVNIVRIR